MCKTLPHLTSLTPNPAEEAPPGSSGWSGHPGSRALDWGGPRWELSLGPTGDHVSATPWWSKGPWLPRAPPSPNSLERSSCSLWAWAPCFPGSWSPYFPRRDGLAFPVRQGGGRWRWWGWGVSPRYLGVHARAAGRLGLHCVPGAGEETRSCGDGEGAQGIWHRHRARHFRHGARGLALDLPVSEPGRQRRGVLEGGGAPGEGRGVSRQSSRSLTEDSVDWSGLAAPGWRGDGQEKASLGLQRLAPQRAASAG